ncbi:MAG TPA: hypothetical protein VN688_12025 [Gemmataceae bacterium]|nr:hypothetical protein [Gemmataceae bacterium]
MNRIACRRPADWHARHGQRPRSVIWAVEPLPAARAAVLLLSAEWLLRKQKNLL